MFTAIEAVADAIMQFEGWKPGSRSYRNRNPGNLRALSSADPQDELGYRVFLNLPDGYAALCNDLSAKFTGHSRTGVGPDSTLLALMQAYAPSADHNHPTVYAAYVAQWVTRALRAEITVNTTLRELEAAQLRPASAPGAQTPPPAAPPAVSAGSKA